MKRLLTVVLVLVLLTLSACSSPTNIEPPDPEQPTGALVDTVDDDKMPPVPPAVEVNDWSRTVTPVDTAVRLTLIEELTAFDSAKAEATDLPLYVCAKWETPLPENTRVQASLYYLNGDEPVCLEQYMVAQDSGLDRERSYFHSSSKWQTKLPLDDNGDLAVALLLRRADTDERYVVTVKVAVDRPFYGSPVLTEGSCLDGQEYYFRYNQKLQDVEWVVLEMREKDAALDAAFSKKWQELETAFVENSEAMVAKGEMMTIFVPSLLACIEDGVLTEEAHLAAEKARERRHLTDEEIALLFSGDAAAINAYFRSPYALLANGKLYSGYWLGSQSAERYAEEDLPLDDLKDLLAFYQSEAAREEGEIGLLRLEAFSETLTAYETLLSK